MSQLLNGHAGTGLDSFASLAGRLIEPQDRERYASVISYVRALPPSDDFRQLAELLGLLALLGQRLPDAAAELLTELREQAKTAGEYHSQVAQRLASLPHEIAAGVDPAVMAEAMSESFRQQIAASSLHDVAALLKGSVSEAQTLSGQFTAVLRPLLNQFKTTAQTITTDLTRLTAASTALQQHNARLIAEAREKSWMLQSAIAVLCVLVGLCVGLAWK